MKKILSKNMKFIKQTLLGLGIALLSSCVTDPYNAVTEKTHDRNEKSEYVYGEGKGKPARQTKNTYTATPEDAKRAEAIREKMFGKGVSAETTPVTVDTTKKETKKTETKKIEAKK